MTYVPDPKPDIRGGVKKALRTFLITVGSLLGLAFIIVWGLGVLGPVGPLEAVTQEQAESRCVASATRQLGEVRSAEVVSITSRQRASRWSVGGEIITEGQLGGYFSHRFSCQVELNQGTWGIIANLPGRAVRLPDPVS